MDQTRVPGAVAKPTPTRLDNRYFLSFVPPVTEGFWGSVTFEFKDGKVVMAEVRETIRP